MKSFGLCCLFLMTMTLCAQGQEIKDGFIIDNQDQFIYGVLQIDNSEKQHTECSFKASSKSEFRKYSSDQINGYGVFKGGKFLSKEIGVDSQPKRMFVKVEFEGLFKLYSYHDRIFLENEVFVELHKADYKSTLGDQLKSCKNIGSFIKRSSFSVKDLAKLVARYEECSKSNFTVVKKIEIHAEGMAGVELNSTKLESNKQAFGFLNGEPLKDKTLWSAGLRLQISMPKVKRLALCTGVHYFQQRFYLISSNEDTGGDNNKVNFDFDEFIVPVNLHLNLSSKEQKIRPYLRGGFSVPIVVKPSLRWEHDEDVDDVIYFEKYQVLNSFKESVQIDLAVGAQFNLSKSLDSFLEVHLNSGKGKITTSDQFSNASITTKSTRLNLMVGLRF